MKRFSGKMVFRGQNVTDLNLTNVYISMSLSCLFFKYGFYVLCGLHINVRFASAPKIAVEGFPWIQKKKDGGFKLQIDLSDDFIN